MKVLTAGWVMASLLTAASTTAQGPDPIGDQFQVNTDNVEYSQWQSNVAADAQGNFVVVWLSYNDYYSSSPDTDGTAIQAQRFNPDGTPAGDEFQVNSYTTSYQITPAVAMDGKGDFVVVWMNGDGTLFSDSSIQGQRFDASGIPVGNEFQVNSYATGTQFAPAVAADAQGNFMVVWTGIQSPKPDSSWSIQGRLYDPTGTPTGEQFQVNSYTTDWQDTPALTVDSQGNFVVVWNSDGSLGSDSADSVQGQRFAANGTRIGQEFQVNSYTTGYQGIPAVAGTAYGDFMVVWNSVGSPGTDSDALSIQGRRFFADGKPMGADFQVNSYTTGNQWLSQVATDPHGNFVVTWESDGSYGTDTSLRSILGQRFSSGRIPVGREFQINTFTSDEQRQPTVAADGQGSFVVVWSSYGPSSASANYYSYTIQGQRYSSGLIFASDLESGDTSAWSLAIP